MIEISNLNIPLAKLDGTPETERAVIRAAVLKRLHVAPDGLLGIELRRRSIDARRKSAVHLTYTVRAQLPHAAGSRGAWHGCPARGGGRRLRGPVLRPGASLGRHGAAAGRARR